MSDKGTVCPLCGSWYSGYEPGVIWSKMVVGDTCGNASSTPKECTIERPCPGKLISMDRFLSVVCEGIRCEEVRLLGKAKDFTGMGIPELIQRGIQMVWDDREKLKRIRWDNVP
jgi:hypothetical protein